MCIIPPRVKWGISSVGRAVASHATGQGFESPMLHKKRHPIGCLFLWSNSGTSHTPARCGGWVSSPVHRVPAGHERLLSTRGSPVGSRAPRGEDTSEPVPRLLPGASGAVRAANGRFATPILPQKPNQKTIWFGFCFALIFNNHAHLGIAGGFAKATPTLALASPDTALPGAKRHQKAKKPTMPTRHGVERRAQALTRSRKPVLLSSNAFQGH